MTSSTQLRRIASHYLLTPQGLLSKPLLTIDPTEQTIISIEQYGDNLDSLAGVEFFSGILCRGFVNAHCHSELSYLLGAIPEGCGGAGFAAAMAEKRGLYSLEQQLEALTMTDCQMWQNGINYVIDIVNSDTSFSVKKSSKIEYLSFAEVFGLKNSNIEQCRKLLCNPNTLLTQHSTYSVQDQDFRAVAEGSSMLSIHFKESEGEQLLYSGIGPLAEWYKQVGFSCDFLHYNSPAERIIKSIPADKKVLLVHNCFITQQDIDIIMGHFTAPVYWVLCPRSNRYISAIEPHNTVELLRKNNLNICIGTDSPASNWSLDILQELKALPQVPLAERLQWATSIGAEAMGVKQRGLIAISGVDFEKMELTDRCQVTRIF